ncbi:MAG: cupredoxin domain-containing protein [Solirubrobacteraceae bacterium]
MKTPCLTPGRVTAVLLLATTSPAGAIAQAGPTDHGRAGTPRLGALSPALAAFPARPRAGDRVRLTVLNLPSDLRGVTWQVSGARAGSRQTLGAGQLSVVFAQPVIHRVLVQMIGAAASQSRTLFVRVAPESRRPGALDAHEVGRARAHRASIPHHFAPRHLAPDRLAPHRVARAAGDPPVGIADFHFTPATVAIHVGDTVTWTNSGPSGHTATARDGSFDTGQLSRGHSASHTFTRAGTYAYFCSIHPFMHGTITVLAATTTSPASAASSPTRATTPTTLAIAATRPTLPNTGLPVDQEAGAALALVTLGLFARRGVPGRRT